MKNRLEGLSDDALLVSLKELVGRSNRITAHILAHLAEVDERRAYRTAACSSLYTYCVYELCLSEDEAQRRVTAARLVRRFPRLLRMLEDASIHLTGLLLIGPHLTDSNENELLERARFRTKRQMQRLVAEICPRPDVPELVQPLHPRPKRARSVYQSFVENGSRNVPPGNTPGGAPTVAGANGGLLPIGAEAHGSAPTPDPTRASADDGAPTSNREHGAHSRAEPNGSTGDREDSSRAGTACELPADTAARPSRSAGSGGSSGAPENPTRASAESNGSTGDQVPANRASAESNGSSAEMPTAPRESNVASGASSPDLPVPTHDVSSPTSGPRREGQQPLAGIGLYGSPPRPDSPAPLPVVQPLSTERYRVQFTADQEHIDLLEEARDLLQHRVPNRDLSAVHKLAMRLLVKELRRTRHADTEKPRSTKRGKSAGRHVPAALKREVWKRDGGRCTYVDARGHRCRETGGLEFHHEDAYARGGPTTAGNLKLRCRAHNRLAAEEDFGRELIERCSQRKKQGFTRVSSGWSLGLARRRYEAAPGWEGDWVSSTTKAQWATNDTCCD